LRRAAPALAADSRSSYTGQSRKYSSTVGLAA
jgi:hypothetical protein